LGAGSGPRDTALGELGELLLPGPVDRDRPSLGERATKDAAGGRHPDSDDLRVARSDDDDLVTLQAMHTARVSLAQPTESRDERIEYPFDAGRARGDDPQYLCDRRLLLERVRQAPIALL